MTKANALLNEAVEWEQKSRDAGRAGDFHLSGHYLNMSRLAFRDAEAAEKEHHS